jgi:iron complex outermembrane receptor protein
LNVGAQYVIRLGGVDTLTPSLNYAHISREWVTLFDNEAQGDHLQDRNLLSAQLAFQHDAWTIAGYGTNLNDQHYVSAVIAGLRFAGPPRQYGIRVSRSF